MMQAQTRRRTWPRVVIRGHPQCYNTPPAANGRREGIVKVQKMETYFYIELLSWDRGHENGPRPVLEETLNQRHILDRDTSARLAVYSSVELHREFSEAYSGFLPRCMKCRRGLAMRILFVRLSVCPSVTRVYCDKTVERSVQIYIPYERTFILVFWEEEW